MAALVALVVCLQTLEVLPRQPAAAAPVSVERIRKQLEKPAAIKVDVAVDRVRSEKPVAKFRTGVEDRVYMLPFLEYLRKEFEMNDLQRQSQEWRSRCCGFNLLSVPKVIDDALKRREERQAREQVTRELAEIQAARKR